MAGNSTKALEQPEKGYQKLGSRRLSQREECGMHDLNFWETVMTNFSFQKTPPMPSIKAMRAEEGAGAGTGPTAPAWGKHMGQAR